MSQSVTKNQLLAVNLRYGVTASSLKILAFADLSSKGLFASSQSLSVIQICQAVAKLIGIRRVDKELIENSLRELRRNSQVDLREELWSLSKNERNRIEKEINSNDVALAKVIEIHFPKNIDDAKLKIWFNDAIVDFYNYYSDEWVRSVCKGDKGFFARMTVDQLINPSLKKHELESNREELCNSFLGLVSSQNVDDQHYLSSVGFAMFSARLVAADVGADPITLDELKNSSFLIDTNILIILRQPGRNRLSAILKPLGLALKNIGAELYILKATEEEYKRVFNAKKAEVNKLFQIFPEEIVANTDDDFILSAKANGCESQDDFIKYFDSIKDIPEEIPYGPKIKIHENSEVIKEVEKAEKDIKFKQSIQNWRLKLTPERGPKSDTALNHDAALVYVSEMEKKLGNKFFILTSDRSFQLCCAERMGQHSFSTTIFLEGLIQILAINNAGPELSATDFAPLLSNILSRKCLPVENLYTLEDIHTVYGIQKNIAGFRPEKIKQILLEINKARISGKKANDVSLQRTVNRMYQDEIVSTNKIVEDSMERAKKAEEVAEIEKKKRVGLEDKMHQSEKKEKLRIAKWKLGRTLLWRIPVSLIAGLVVFVLAIYSLNNIQKKEYLSFLLSLCSVFGVGYAFLKNPIQAYVLSKKDFNEK